jgi:hypothetical protein
MQFFFCIFRKKQEKRNIFFISLPSRCIKGYNMRAADSGGQSGMRDAGRRTEKLPEFLRQQRVADDRREGL